MKVTRILVLVVALGAGLLAAVLMRGMLGGQEPAEASKPVVSVNMEKVLVAKADIGLGAKVSQDQLGWQSWPEAALTDQYIKKSERPNAISKLSGTIARSPFLNGEPINDGKLIRSDRGFMSAILPKGKRAVAVEVRAANTAGGFILPNDRVDVILTQKAPKGGGAGNDAYVSQTILENIRVLAIDQKLKEEKGAKAVVAKDTATLELSPRQSEMIVQAAQLGTISLTLRSIADSKPSEVATEDGPTKRGGINMVKYGVTTKITTRR